MKPIATAKELAALKLFWLARVQWKTDCPHGGPHTHLFTVWQRQQASAVHTRTILPN